MGLVYQVKFLPAAVVAEHLRGPESESVQVIDVRDDDFNVGGHIRGATNLPKPFFTEDANIDGLIQGLKSEGKKRIIFHCHYSQQRGPWCAERFASRLEAVGGVEIDYINILQGGYKGFSKLYINDQDLVDTSNMNQYFME